MIPRCIDFKCAKLLVCSCLSEGRFREYGGVNGQCLEVRKSWQEVVQVDVVHMIKNQGCDVLNTNALEDDSCHFKATDG